MTFSSNIRSGCKLLLTGIIQIKDSLLQLTRDNTYFQYGSKKFARPRSIHQVNNEKKNKIKINQINYFQRREGGSYRTSYEGRCKSFVLFI